MNDSVQTTPAERLNALANALTATFSANDCKVSREFGEVTMIVPAETLLRAAQILRDDEQYRFDQVIDICGVDYGSYGQSEWETADASSTGFARAVDRDEAVIETENRYAVVYHLLSVEHNVRLRLRVYAAGEVPAVDSVVGIWSAANWFEREAFDLYGILFSGHPDLRRILTDYGFVGHPFRKDFPLIGQVEMRYDPEKQRVVYEPVSVEPRTLVPKVIRDDGRFGMSAATPEEKTDA